MLNAAEAALLRRAIALAGEASTRGDGPVAAVIAGADGTVLAEAGSMQGASDASTLAYSEMNALSAVLAAGAPRPVLRASTMYFSGEPCAMCQAAAFLAGIGRVV